VGCSEQDEVRASASRPTPTAVSAPISKATWTGGVWPFTVPDGVLKCYSEDSMVKQDFGGSSGAPYATVRLRQRLTKGPGSRAGVAMAFKLIESAQARWRAVNAPHLVALVRAGARFEKGKFVE
jgi:hypothetical protein